MVLRGQDQAERRGPLNASEGCAESSTRSSTHLRHAAVTRRCTWRSRASLNRYFLWTLGFQMRRDLQQHALQLGPLVALDVSTPSNAGWFVQAAGGTLLRMYQRGLHRQLSSEPPLLWLVAQAKKGPHLFLPSSLTLLPDSMVLPPYKPRRARLTSPRTTCSTPSGITAQLPASPALAHPPSTQTCSASRKGPPHTLESWTCCGSIALQSRPYCWPSAPSRSAQEVGKQIANLPGARCAGLPRAQRHRAVMLHQALLHGGLAPPPWRALPQPGAQRCCADRPAPRQQPWQPWTAETSSPCRRGAPSASL